MLRRRRFISYARKIVEYTVCRKGSFSLDHQMVKETDSIVDEEVLELEPGRRALLLSSVRSSRDASQLSKFHHHHQQKFTSIHPQINKLRMIVTIDGSSHHPLVVASFQTYTIDLHHCHETVCMDRFIMWRCTC